MTVQDYTKSILVSADANAAFDAVTEGIEFWWTRPDQPLCKIGDRAKFTFPPGNSYWTFELTRLDRPSRAEWTCVEARHIHEGQPKEIEQEWLGTKVNWTIAPDDHGTKIEIKHTGLTPELYCYDVCQAGWDLFFLGSLKDYLDTGTGSPHRGS